LRIAELKRALEALKQERPDANDNPESYSAWQMDYGKLSQEIQTLEDFEREIIHCQVENPDGSLMIIVFKSVLEKEIFLRVHASEKARVIIENDTIRKTYKRRKNLE